MPGANRFELGTEQIHHGLAGERVANALGELGIVGRRWGSWLEHAADLLAAVRRWQAILHDTAAGVNLRLRKRQS